MTKRDTTHLTHCFRCEVRAKAEETVEHRVCTSYNIAKPYDSTLMNGINAWVGVRLTEPMKYVVEWRVNIAISILIKGHMSLIVRVRISAFKLSMQGVTG